MSLEKSQLITAEQSVSCMRTSLSTNTTIICPNKAQAQLSNFALHIYLQY